MENTVYVDVLLVSNLIIDYCLIRLTAKLAGLAPKNKRMIFAAALSSLFSLTIFLPPLSRLGESLARLVFAAATVLAAFGLAPFREFAKRLFFFFTFSFLFAGLMLALWMLTNSSRMLCYNGIVYFGVSPLTMVLSVCLCYAVCWLYDRMVRRQAASAEYYQVELTLEGKNVHLRGFVDTGNTLCDFFTGAPVAVCSYESISPLLSQPLRESVDAVLAGLATVPLSGPALRILPYRTVGGENLIPCVKPDRMLLTSEQGEGRFEVKRMLIGISDKPLGCTSYQILLNAMMIQEQIATGGKDND